MPPYKTQVCLVSGQAAPNLLPLLDDRFKPDKVVLVVTPQMQQRSEWLQQVIKPRGIKVEIIQLENADNFDAIQNALLELVADDQKKDSLALNVTGGTKWMAIAAQEIFRLNDSPVFYVDVETDEIRFIGDKQEDYKLTHQIDIVNYLKAYGYQIENNQKEGLPQRYHDLCQELIHKVTDWEQEIGFLNHLASRAAETNNLNVHFGGEKVDQKTFGQLLTCLEDAQIIKDRTSDRFEFWDNNAVTVANGGWLELYVNKLLGELRGRGVLQDSPRLNLVVSNGKSKNEIDVAFMANNRLHIVECKTKRFLGGGQHQAGAEAVYKLDSISELGGIGTKASLVTYKKPRKADCQRAKDLRIELFHGPALKKLKSHLQKWISKG